MSWGVETTCFKAPRVSLGGSGVSIGGVRSLRVVFRWPKTFLFHDFLGGFMAYNITSDVPFNNTSLQWSSLAAWNHETGDECRWSVRQVGRCLVGRLKSISILQVVLVPTEVVVVARPYRTFGRGMVWWWMGYVGNWVVAWLLGCVFSFGGRGSVFLQVIVEVDSIQICRTWKWFCWKLNGLDLPVTTKQPTYEIRIPPSNLII